VQDRGPASPDSRRPAAVARGTRLRRRGRPRDPTSEAAIVRATIDLLTEVGVDGTTTNAIAERSGSSKSTIYRRWSTRDALILDALRLAAGGRPDDIRSVIDLERDLGSTLQAAAQRGAQIFDSKILRAVLPTLARELLAGTAVGEQFRKDVFVPIRAAAKSRLLEAVKREEISPAVDPDLVFDLIYGGLLYRVLVGEPVTEVVARSLADLVMSGAAGRRYRGDGT
jgi:AcrR family transcriptional regulator